jgi:hypothetical protein
VSGFKLVGAASLLRSGINGNLTKVADDKKHLAASLLRSGINGNTLVILKTFLLFLCRFSSEKWN